MQAYVENDLNFALQAKIAAFVSGRTSKIKIWRNTCRKMQQTTNVGKTEANQSRIIEEKTIFQG